MVLTFDISSFSYLIIADRLSLKYQASTTSGGKLHELENDSSKKGWKHNFVWSFIFKQLFSGAKRSVTPDTDAESLIAKKMKVRIRGFSTQLDFTCAQSRSL